MNKQDIKNRLVEISERICQLSDLDEYKSQRLLLAGRFLELTEVLNRYE